MNITAASFKLLHGENDCQYFGEIVNSDFLACLYICPLKREKVGESLQAWLWGWVSSAGCSVLGETDKWKDGALVFHHNWGWPGFKSAPCSLWAMPLSMQRAKE